MKRNLNPTAQALWFLFATPLVLGRYLQRGVLPLVDLLTPDWTPDRRRTREWLKWYDRARARTSITQAALLVVPATRLQRCRIRLADLPQVTQIAITPAAPTSPVGVAGTNGQGNPNHSSLKPAETLYAKNGRRYAPVNGKPVDGPLYRRVVQGKRTKYVQLVEVMK